MEIKNIAEGFLNLAKKELDIADENVEKVAIWRYSKCLQCENLQSDKTCKICGCFMKAKTRAMDASCPISKW